jgi:poly(A) polymerase
MKKCLDHQIFKIISKVATDNDTPAYVVGGYVRDAILKRKNTDIDIVVVGNGIEMARKTAKEIHKDLKVSVFKNFGTAMFRFGDFEVEFVGARKESYRQDSRKPVVEDGTLEDDQKRRDFTINAMALALNEENFGTFLDPFNGMSDLEHKRIRTPLDPDHTFSDDPLRMIRAMRFAAQLEFTIDGTTHAAIQRNRERIRIVSTERITEEINKIMQSDQPSIGLKLLESTGLLGMISPELSAMKGVASVNGMQHKDNFFHTLKVLDNVSRLSKNLWLRWAALLHDIGKPATKKFIPGQGWTFHGHDYIGSRMVPDIFRKLKLPLGAQMRYVKKLVRLHLRPIALVEEQVTDSAIRRLLFDAGDDIDDLMTLCEADITSKNEVKVKTYLRNFSRVRKKLKEIEEKDALRNFQPPVSGEEIMEFFGIPPSREVGIIKTAIKDAILEGKIGNNHEEAWQFMIRKGREMGLEPR